MNDNMKIKYFDEELEVYDERRIVNKNTYSITLNYVPSPTRPLTVENGKTTLTETNGTPNANQYVLDRENGLLLFNQAMKGKVVTINYSAIGLWCISADKVYTNVDNKGKIVETLEDLMKENRQAIESIKTVGDASTVITQLQANIDSVTGLVGNIAEGSSVNEELTKSITSGKGTNITLTNTISSANNKINEMNTWVNQHGDIVNLDNRVDAVETEIPKINEQLKSNTQQLQEHLLNHPSGGEGGGSSHTHSNLIALNKITSENVDKYNAVIEDYVTPQMFGAKADNTTDDTQSIQNAINYAKEQNINKVFVPAGKYVVTSLLIPEFFTFEGVGRGTIFIQTNTATGDIIKFKQGACFSTVKGFKLQSTYDTTKPIRHGICMTDYVNEYGYFDSGNIVENIYISDVTGDGVYVGWSQRGCRLENIDITRCNKSGIRVHGSDNSITNCNVSVCKEPDIMNDWGGWNNRYIGCKGFHAGVDNTASNVSPETYMMRILGNYNHVFSDMQESVGGALRLQGSGNKIDLMIDACGKKSYETGIETTVIKIDESSIGNNIRANIIDGTLNGYSKYMLDISNKAFNNIIDLTFFQSGDLDKRQDIQLNKTPYHFSNVVKLNGISYVPVLYEKVKFTSVNGNDGINILWNVQQEGDTYTIDINKSLNALNNNGWMYLCFNNKLNNDMVQEAKKHNGGILQLQFDLKTNAILSEKYIVDVITFAGETTSTDVFQRWTKQGTIYMNIPCKILEEATEYSIAIGIRKMESENTVTQPPITTLKVSNFKISFGDYIEDRQVLSNLAKTIQNSRSLGN